MGLKEKSDQLIRDLEHIDDNQAKSRVIHEFLQKELALQEASRSFEDSELGWIKSRATQIFVDTDLRGRNQEDHRMRALVSATIEFLRKEGYLSYNISLKE